MQWSCQALLVNTLGLTGVLAQEALKLAGGTGNHNRYNRGIGSSEEEGDGSLVTAA